MTIKEVATKFNITTDTLRYYEKVGLLNPVPKTKSGIRDYQEEDIKRIEFVKCMRGANVSIHVLKQYLDLFELGNASLKQRRELLIGEQKNLELKIQDMKKALDKLNHKIELYDQQLLDYNIKK